jgi:release factor glutamine methyltransferase
MYTPRSCLARDTPKLCAALNLEPAEARSEIRVLLGHALGVNRAWLVAHGHDALDGAAVAAYESLIVRRLGGEPVAYILGEKEFFGRSFRIAPGVLVPRPETELLVELGLEQAAGYDAPRILDLGTGSGCIAITLALECRTCKVTASDRSAAALDIARGNAARLGADVRFCLGDWYQALPRDTDKFELVVSNPPYIAEGDIHLAALTHEPAQALSSGTDGLHDIRLILQDAARHLAPGGWVMLEHGWDQAGAVQALMKGHGLGAIETRADLAGIGRVTLGRLA